MKSANCENVFFSWATQKDEDGRFCFTVTRNASQSEALPCGGYLLTEIKKTGAGFATRARAKSRAIMWVKHFAYND